ncbi:hypothetical protein [Kitasatospora griseola]|uniref:hypothetical protein n=1 Tax=Kitasatospora griseola TaxID=2064 RepID=UPI00166FF1E1|nr:hypothetical protein [Kitasatospora griseola]GGR04390.1 hypothetical protein GCM10010195_69840 [Kitasatospora griseola]
MNTTPTAPAAPAPVIATDQSTDPTTARDESLTEVTLTIATEDGSDYRDVRKLTLGQLTGLLLAFDAGEVDADFLDEEEPREMTLEYAPSEYSGRPWGETRFFEESAADQLLQAFEAGAPLE